jgi:pimeloyl-ACP methyl ester carboxylesterase
MYQALNASRSEFVTIRQLSYHVRQWGEPVAGQAPMVLLHGWMDVSASWQFMVDALTHPRWIIAPDWRGFGLTRHPSGSPDGYWFPDYLADVDALLNHYVGDQPVDLVGHSMGGNIAMIYGGVRARRVRRLVNLEGFGLPASSPDQAPGRYAKWLDELQAVKRGEMDLKAYDTPDGVARRLMKTNPRLPQDKADWLARHWAAPNAKGQWEVLGDPAHKVTNANLYQVEEALAIYRSITAPVLSVVASDDSLGMWWGGTYTLAQYQERIEAVPILQRALIDDAGHMLHHDQPEALARLIEPFFDARS